MITKERIILAQHWSKILARKYRLEQDDLYTRILERIWLANKEKLHVGRLSKWVAIDIIRNSRGRNVKGVFKPRLKAIKTTGLRENLIKESKEILNYNLDLLPLSDKQRYVLYKKANGHKLDYIERMHIFAVRTKLKKLGITKDDFLR